MSLAGDAPGIGVPVRAGVVGTVAVELRASVGRGVVIARTASDRRRGALARRDGDSLAEAARSALRLRVPLVLELASSGADVSEGIDALHGWGGAAAAVVACSGVVPVIAAATGPVISGPALLLGLADLVVMTQSAVAFVSGPSMVAEFTGVQVGLEALGGASVHARSSGLCALETDDVGSSVAQLLGYLPRHADEAPPAGDSADPPERTAPELRSLVPTRQAASYDVRDVIHAVADDGTACELWSRWAPQLVTAFAHLGGRAVGMVANQSQALAGTLDIAASQKGARFVRLCDAFNLPIVTFVDTPGFLPGKDLEWRGMIRHGAELAFAYAEATVPRLCVILRKAFGGAYIVMDSKGLGNDLCLAWPGAEVAVMGASGAAQILYRREEPGARKRHEESYSEDFLTPWPAAERGFVDTVIDPADTRSSLVAGLAAISSKREALAGKKHDGGPL
ncbi:MAG: acyl-CoA carboxylase subunit beta [Acidimicrobiales bacterium]